MNLERELNLELFAKMDKVWMSILFTWSTNMESPVGNLCLFSVAFTTTSTAVSLDRWLLESDKLFRTVGNEMKCSLQS